MKITRLETDLLRVPLPRPVSQPGGQDTNPASTVDLLLVRVVTESGPVGLGFAYSFTGGTTLRAVVDELVSPLLVGEDPGKVEWIFARVQTELEGIGFPGLVARAYAAVDFALWDWKGKHANLPVFQLLGGYRTKLKAIAADTASPALGAKAAAKETRAALDRGAAGVLVEIGTHDPDVDADRVRQMREAVPDGAWFEVSAAGRFDYSSALWLGRVFEEEFGIDGFADPIRPDDLDGLRRLGDRLETALSAGAGIDRIEDFQRLLDVVRVDSVRVDPLRLGGLTPARKVAMAAELKRVAVCPVRLPEIGTHLACGVVWGRVCEHVDWLSELFEGGPRFENGQLVVSSDPGLGLTIRDKIAAKWRV